MRLREHAVYIKLTTYADALDSGRHVWLVQRLEAVGGCEFTRFRDLAATRMPAVPLAGRRSELLDAHIGAGFHQACRFRLETDADSVRSVELNAGLHPYSGVYSTHIDIRLGDAWANTNADALRALTIELVAELDPLTLQVHDVDDDAIQNVDNPRLLELGYGIDAAELGDRPGREASRGQFRFAVNWLTYLGPDALGLLELPADPAGFPDVAGPQACGPGVLFVLGDRPSDSAAGEFRDRQRTLRAALGFDRLISNDRRMYSYWKTKP